MLTDKVMMVLIQLIVMYGYRKGTFTLYFHKLLQRLYTASYNNVAVSDNKIFLIYLSLRIKIET